MNLKKLRAKVVLEDSFFIPLLQKIEIKQNSEIPAPAATDGRTIYVNEELMNIMPEDQQYATLLHELLHIAYLHSKRFTELKGNKKSQQAWNIATDCIINEKIREAKKIQIDGAIYKEDIEKILNKEIKIEKETAETLYKKLIDKANDDESGCEQEIQELPEKGELTEKANDLMEGDTQEIEKFAKEVRKALLEGQVYERQRGTEKGTWSEILKDLLTPEIDWKKVIKQKLQQELDKFARSYQRPHRKKSSIFSWQVIYPGPSKVEKLLKVTAVIDTSGSMDREDLRKILTELYGLIQQFRISEMTVIQHDTEIQDITTIRSKNELKNLEIRGRGGTSYIDVLEYLVRKSNGRKEIVIWFTDGYGDQDTNKFQELLKQFTRRGIIYFTKVRNGKIEKIMKNQI